MSHLVNYNYPFPSVKDRLFKSILREYLDWGVNSFVFNVELAMECCEIPEAREQLRLICREFGVSFRSMHGLCGRIHDLNIPEKEDRERMLEGHRQAMTLAAEFGSKTYTVHVGAYHYVYEHIRAEESRPRAKQALEALLPLAEKLGIVIAVENSFEAVNSPDEVLGIVKDYLDSPSMGVCYDTGHANIMTSYPWKKLENYERYMPNSWWDSGIIEEPHALEKLAPYVVTCHIHDNNACGDHHSLPFDGCIDWNVLMPKLFACPRMLEYQTETCFDYGTNWAGTLPAPVGGYSIKRQVETFRKLGFQ